MDTRRKLADAKRKAEEETKRLKMDKRRMEEDKAPRKKGRRIGRYDLLVERNLPKIYLGGFVEVKNEIKVEPIEDDEGPSPQSIDEEIQVFPPEEMDKEGDRVTDDINLNLENVMPMILQWLKQKDVFRCRLVSKQWRGIVDDFIKELIVPKEYDDKDYQKKVKSDPSQLCPLPKFRIVKYAYKFERERDLGNFNEVMRSHMDSGSDLSPFVGGAGATVILKNLFIGSTDLSLATKTFLENFGAHVGCLVIEQLEMEPQGFLDRVKKCLHYVPNLERLKLLATKVIYKKRKLNDFLKELYRKELVDRMPKLGKLNTFEFEYSPFVVYDEEEDGNASDYYDWLNKQETLGEYLEEALGDLMINPYYQSQLIKFGAKYCANKLLELRLCNVKELSVFNFQCKLKLKDLKLQRSPVVKLTVVKPCSEISFEDILKQFPCLRYLCIDKEVLTSGFTDCESDVHTLEIVDMESQDYIPDILEFVFPKLRYLILRSCNKYEVKTLDGDFDENLRIGRMKIAHLICGGTSYDLIIWRKLVQLEVITFQFQDHIGYNSNPNQRRDVDCECEFVKGTKYECPFRNIVETREGYHRYQKRVSRLVEQCFNQDNSVNGNHPSQANCSKTQDCEQNKITRKTFLERENTEIIGPNALPFILPYLGQNDVFRCRGVDKQWRQMVDDFIESSIVPQQYDDKLYLKNMEIFPNQPCPLPKFRNVKYAYNFNSERILELFNETMATHEDSDLSPFVGGCGATITLDNLFVNFPLVTPALKEFLENFGVHVRSLVIEQTGTENEMDTVRFVEYVKWCLQKSPALERLSIVATLPVQEEQSEMDRIQIQVYRNELINRLPKLEKLTSLQFQFSYLSSTNFELKIQRVSYMDEILHDVMIKPFYQTQLKHLQLDGSLRLLSNIKLKMCNLKELTVKIVENDSKIILPGIGSGKWIEAPVEKLTLIIDSTDIKLLFNILQMFPGVGYLKFENSRVSVSDPTGDCEASIPPSTNIHTLELVDTFLPDAVFRGFSKVKFIIIGEVSLVAKTNKFIDDDQLAEREKMEESGTMEFSTYYFSGYEDEGTTYKTGIWELLPSVEVLKVQFQEHDCCTNKELMTPRCKSIYVKGSRDECPFKNLVDTRKGYNMLYERLARLMPQFKSN